MAQVVAAGKAINDTVANLAVTTKMIRVMMLAPFLLVLSYGMSRYTHHDSASRRIVIPWFALAFIGVMLINSLIHLPPACWTPSPPSTTGCSPWRWPRSV